VDEVARALIDVIGLIDFWRPSWKRPSGSKSQLSLHPPYSTLEQRDPEFPKELVSWMEEYGDRFQGRLTVKRFIFYLILILFGFVLNSEIILPLFSINPFSGLAYLSAVALVLCILIVTTLYINDPL
jgi:hypothetical protein